jgi:hypothetical protein
VQVQAPQERLHTPPQPPYITPHTHEPNDQQLVGTWCWVWQHISGDRVPGNGGGTRVADSRRVTQPKAMLTPRHTIPCHPRTIVEPHMHTSHGRGRGRQHPAVRAHEPEVFGAVIDEHPASTVVGTSLHALGDIHRGRWAAHLPNSGHKHLHSPAAGKRVGP